MLPDDHVVVRRRRQDWKQIVRIGRSACDQCSFCTELCPRWLLGHPIEPHKAMRSLEFNLVGEANVIGTSFCCECNLCSLYSCPEDLDPEERLHAEQASAGGGEAAMGESAVQPRRPELHLNNRKAPMARLFTKLGLRQFATSGRYATHFLAAGQGRNQTETTRRRGLRAGGEGGRPSDQGASGRPCAAG